MKTLETYLNEIRTLARHNNTGITIATEMFLNNIKDANDPNDQYKYDGLKNFDYKALQPYFKELNDDKNNFIENHRLDYKKS